jgi:ribonuclease VapC
VERQHSTRHAGCRSQHLVAILFSEPGYLDIIDRILMTEHVRIGAPTLTETSLVFAGRRGRRTEREVDDLVRELGVTVVPFGEAEWRAAVDAFARYGRGRHKAELNFGDCLAYAAAATADDRLLYVGDDFTHTDLA